MLRQCSLLLTSSLFYSHMQHWWNNKEGSRWQGAFAIYQLLLGHFANRHHFYRGVKILSSLNIKMFGGV